jgi:hypothetical protein
VHPVVRPPRDVVRSAMETALSTGDG